MYHYAGNNPVRYIDPDGREEYDSTITKEQFDNIHWGKSFSLDGKQTVAGKTWEETQQFFKDHPNGCLYRNPDETCFRFYTNEDKDTPVQYNMVTGDELLFIGLGKGLFSLGKSLVQNIGKNILKKQVGKVSIHGAARIAGESATRGGVLSAKEILKTRKLAQQVFSANNGTVVSVFQNPDGTFNLVIDGSKGLVSTLKNISQKSFNRLAKNYGFTLIQ